MTKIKVEVAGKELELSVEEASKLWVELGMLFGNRQEFPWVIPTIPLIPYEPLYPYITWS